MVYSLKIVFLYYSISMSLGRVTFYVLANMSEVLLADNLKCIHKYCINTI